MASGLQHAGTTPPDRPEHLPPPNPVPVDCAAAHALVPPEQILVGAEAANRVLAAEAPRAHTQVTEVLAGVASMDKLPIEHTADPVLADDQVAEPKIAVQD